MNGIGVNWIWRPIPSGQGDVIQGKACYEIRHIARVTTREGVVKHVDHPVLRKQTHHEKVQIAILRPVLQPYIDFNSAMREKFAKTVFQFR